MVQKWITSLLIVFICSACLRNDDGNLIVSNESELWAKAVTYLTPLDKSNWLENLNLSPQKIKLGRELFLDKRLSLNENQSCNTCHDLNSFGVDNKKQSSGHNGELEKRNTPSVYNAALHFAQFWDGRAASLKEQAAIPILNKNEMGIPSEAFLVNRLKQDTSYQLQFDQVFKDEKPSLSFDHIVDALAAFESTLVTSSRVDDYLLGDFDAMSALEKQGLNTFIDLGCSPCHSGKGLGGEMMHRFALQGYYWDVTKSDFIDLGRYEISEKEEDKYVFKIPSLRNVAETAPYFHDGSVSNLEEAVKIMANVQLNYDIQEKEIERIVAFLNALSTNEK